MWQGLITGALAICATLAGAWQHDRFDRRRREADRADARRTHQREEKLNTAVALLSAVANHRRAMWVLGETWFDDGADEASRAEARTCTHETRATLTQPRALFGILLPELATQAEAAVDATFVMRDCATMAVLESRRELAVTAEETLRRAVTAYMLEDSL